MIAGQDRRMGDHSEYPDRRVVEVGHVGVMAAKLEYFDSRTKVWGPDGSDDTIRDTATVHASEDELDKIFEKHDMGERVRLDIEDRDFYSTDRVERHLNYMNIVARNDGCVKLALNKEMGRDD